MNSIKTIARITTAGAFALSLVSVGVAASAQTAPAPATTVPVTNPATVNAQTTNATTVTMATIVTQPDRKADLERDITDQRRIAFRHEGFNL